MTRDGIGRLPYRSEKRPLDELQTATNRNFHSSIRSSTRDTNPAEASPAPSAERISTLR